MNWSQVLGLTVIGAIVTTSGTLLGLFLKELFFARSFERWKATQSLEQVSKRYQEPIALSALELSNRLSRISEDYPPNFTNSQLLTTIPEGPVLNSAEDLHFKKYTLVSTVYRLCAFLGWLELYRQETTYLDVNSGSGKRRIDQKLFAVRSDLADGQLNTNDDWESWYDVLLFREEQRAIGEAMIVGVGGGRTIMGYGAFSNLFLGDANSDNGQWLRRAASFFFDFKKTKDFRKERIERLIVHLIELVDVLSPNRLREEHLAALNQRKSIAAESSV